MSAVTAIVVYISLFFVAFLTVTVCLMLFRKALPMSSPPFPPYTQQQNRGLNPASGTTAARKESTLNNPVGMLNGQQVYLKVSTNPPR